jgi:hypothetical protein
LTVVVLRSVRSGQLWLTLYIFEMPLSVFDTVYDMKFSMWVSAILDRFVRATESLTAMILNWDDQAKGNLSWVRKIVVGPAT